MILDPFPQYVVPATVSFVATDAQYAEERRDLRGASCAAQRPSSIPHSPRRRGVDAGTRIPWVPFMGFINGIGIFGRFGSAPHRSNQIERNVSVALFAH